MKPQDVGAFEAKTHLSKLLEKVKNGQSFYITKHGRRLAELRPVTSQETRHTFGCDQGQVTLSPDFDAPLPGMKDYLP